MSRRVFVVVVSITLAISMTAGAHAARGTRSCAVPTYPGAGYFTSLTAKGASCATARAVALGYYRCRIKHGRKGRCSAPVRGFRCVETRTSIPTELNARVTCRRRSETVTHTYQQNL